MHIYVCVWNDYIYAPIRRQANIWASACLVIKK